MRTIKDAEVHLIVTSPPYWQLKDYGMPEQIGYHDSYEEYINNLNLAWQECYRILHPGCRLCINIGDQYARAAYYQRYKVIPIRTEIIKFCESYGFDYMGAIIWQKTGTMNPSGGGTVMGSFPYPRNGILKLDYEFILIFKKQGKTPPPTLLNKKAAALSSEDWNRYFRGHWNFAGVRQEKHLAMFPPELPKRLIRMFSFVGDTVLDPFAGSGTTNSVARALNRSSVAYELNPQFVNIIRDNLHPIDSDDGDCQYEYLEDIPLSAEERKERLSRLPYLFKDFHQLQRQADPQKNPYGSRISMRRQEPSTFLAVKEIMSPNLIRLSNEHVVRLIGVAEKEKQRQQAIRFLKEKTKGEKVFLKYDKLREDKNKNLFCYLYLKNKTFINAKLIQSGFVEVDTKIDFKHKDKFLNLRQNYGA